MKRMPAVAIVAFLFVGPATGRESGWLLAAAVVRAPVAAVLRAPVAAVLRAPLLAGSIRSYVADGAVRPRFAAWPQDAQSIPRPTAQVVEQVSELAADPQIVATFRVIEELEPLSHVKLKNCHAECKEA